MCLTRVLTLTSAFSSQHHKLKENVPNSKNHVKPCYGAEVIRKLGKNCSNTCWDEKIALAVSNIKLQIGCIYMKWIGLAYGHCMFTCIKPGPIRFPMFAEKAYKANSVSFMRVVFPSSFVLSSGPRTSR